MGGEGVMTSSCTCVTFALGYACICMTLCVFVKERDRHAQRERERERERERPLHNMLSTVYTKSSDGPKTYKGHEYSFCYLTYITRTII